MTIAISVDPIQNTESVRFADSIHLIIHVK